MNSKFWFSNSSSLGDEKLFFNSNMVIQRKYFWKNKHVSVNLFLSRNAKKQQKYKINKKIVSVNNPKMAIIGIMILKWNLQLIFFKSLLSSFILIYFWKYILTSERFNFCVSIGPWVIICLNYFCLFCRSDDRRHRTT